MRGKTYRAQQLVADNDVTGQNFELKPQKTRQADTGSEDNGETHVVDAGH